MTCIVGLIDGDKVWMGGDSAGVAGLDLTIRKDAKVFRNGDFLMGFTTSFRMGQLLEHRFKPPKRHLDTDLFAYMVTDFVDGVRQCLKDGGFAERKNESEQGGTFLVGYQGHLFSVESDYQVAEQVCGYAACGCGQPFALGSMFATAGKPAEERISTALKCAETFSAGVRGPFTVFSVG